MADKQMSALVFQRSGVTRLQSPQPRNASGQFIKRDPRAEIPSQVAQVLDGGSLRANAIPVAQEEGDAPAGNLTRLTSVIRRGNARISSQLKIITELLRDTLTESRAYHQSELEAQAQAYEQQERLSERKEDLAPTFTPTREEYAPATHTKPTPSGPGFFENVAANGLVYSLGQELGKRFLGPALSAAVAAVTSPAALTAAVGALAVGSVGAMWYGLLQKWMQSHSLFNQYKTQGRYKEAQYEATQLGNVDMSQDPDSLAVDVANRFQTGGMIKDADWKAMGVAKHPEGQGFTVDEANKFLEWRQLERNKPVYGSGTPKSWIAAALGGPVQPKLSTPKSTSMWQPIAVPQGALDYVPTTESAPATATVPPAAAPSTPTKLTPNIDPDMAILNAIAPGESGAGGYDATYGNGLFRPDGNDVTAPPVSNMTMEEIFNLQKAMVGKQKQKGISEDRRSSAVGKYQFILPTLFGKTKDLAKPDPTSLFGRYHLSPSTKFNASTQDMLGKGLVQDSRNKATKIVQQDPKKDFGAEFNNALAGVWASVQTTNGKGYYPGQRAGTSLDASLLTGGPGPTQNAKLFAGAPGPTSQPVVIIAGGQAPAAPTSGSGPGIMPIPVPINARGRSVDTLLSVNAF